MNFYSRWQPLVDEDRYTALVFGFFRHIPVELALEPWLERVFARPLEASPLSQASFWPGLRSVVDGSEWTEPELVFDADDGEPLKLVVEVKPGYDMQRLEQIAREVVDVASDSRAKRIAIIMVGADLGRPVSTDGWDEKVAEKMVLAGLAIEAEVQYSSFALLGEVIADAGRKDAAWAAYAMDVIAQLKRKGLLGYEGAPMLDDLEGLTLQNGVETFNRIIKAARQFYLQLQGQPAFAASGLQPDVAAGNVSGKMLRNGRSEVVTQKEEWFETTMIVYPYLHPDLPERDRVFVGFDLCGRANGAIEMIAGLCRDYPSDVAYRLAESVPREKPSNGDPPQLPYETSDNKASWLYDRRPWQPGLASEDVEWALSRAAAAVQAAHPPLNV